MQNHVTTVNFWRPAFFSLFVFYGLFYAPYGINDTDGGFLTGLAWQVASGKSLYSDVVYVRPPMSVWLRWLELCILPENWAILGERWFFYGKVALYSWLGAAVLFPQNDDRRWMPASLGFVLSVHCYPPAAWHTIDGILFSVLSIWCWTNFSSRRAALLSGLCILGALLCKQSFYPMAVVWVLLLSSAWQSRKAAVLLSIGSALLALTVFIGYLYQHNILLKYWQLTSGAASGGAALQHGLLDFFRINPMLLAASIFLLVLGVFLWNRKRKEAVWSWAAWLLLLLVSYGWTIWQRHEFTIPFAQSRLLFLLALGFSLYQLWKKKWTKQYALRFLSLLAISWCAAISWGYNLPLLFALPWAFVVLEISTQIRNVLYPGSRLHWLPVFSLLLLLGVFRLGYEFVYRDGPRSEMTEHLGAVFPRLSGIYSTPETLARYQDLRALAHRYGPDFKTLPALPWANFLCDSKPPLPLDWVVKREIGTGQNLVEATMQEGEIAYFIQIDMLDRIDNDPELQVTKQVCTKGRIVEKTTWFWVVLF
jgi:hypothetical protein